MQPSARVCLWFGIGIPLLLVALFLQNVTVADGRYAGLLIAGLLITTIADICFVQAFRRGRLVARCVGVLLLLPTLFVVADFVRRAPYLFR